jgi:hypothetical protein
MNIADINGYAMRQPYFDLQIPRAGEPPGGRFRLQRLTKPPTLIESESAGGRDRRIYGHLYRQKQHKDGSHYADAFHCRLAKRRGGSSDNKFIHGTQ